MKTMVLISLLVILIGLSISAAKAIPTAPLDQCPDQDVWVYIRYTLYEIGDPSGRVVVHIPKRTLEADFKNCPSDDIKLMGKSRFTGFHVVTLKKGYLNNVKNYTIFPPGKTKVPGNNFNTWHVGK